MKKVIKTAFGVFVGQRRGDCIKLSVPAQTEHEWTLKTEFLDLPLMDKLTYSVFVGAIAQMRELFEDE